MLLLSPAPGPELDEPEGAGADCDPTIPTPVALTPMAVSFSPTGVAAPTSSGAAYSLGVVYSM